MNPHRHRILAAGAAAVMTVGIAACGSSSSSSTTARTQPAKTTTAAGTTAAAPVSSATIKIAGYAYHPANLELLPGAKVTFVNTDPTNHTATEKAGPSSFDTGTLGQGKSMTVVLKQPGTYTYYCQFHAFMVAHLTVVKK